MSKYNVGLVDILNHLLFFKKMRPIDLAKKTGVPQPTVHRMVAGTCLRPHKKSLQPIADYFDITIEQLKGDEPIDGLNIFKLNQLDGWAKIPLLNWQRLKTWPGAEIRYQISEVSVEKQRQQQNTTFTETNVNLKAFAVYLEDDDDMTPEFSAGMRLVFDPDVKITDQCFTLLRLENKEILFRQAIIKDEQYYYQTLNPLNNDTPQSLQYNDKVLGVLVEAQKEYQAR